MQSLLMLVLSVNWSLSIPHLYFGHRCVSEITLRVSFHPFLPLSHFRQTTSTLDLIFYKIVNSWQKNTFSISPQKNNSLKNRKQQSILNLLSVAQLHHNYTIFNPKWLKTSIQKYPPLYPVFGALHNSATRTVIRASLTERLKQCQHVYVIKSS